MKNFPFAHTIRSFLYSSKGEGHFLYGTEETAVADISGIIKFALDTAYNDFLSGHHPLINIFASHRSGLLGSSNLVHEFENKFEIPHLFSKFPVLKDILRLKTNSSAQFIDSILACLKLDQLLLEKELGIMNFKIQSIELGSGDVHQEGKSAAIIHFEDGGKVVFKPRPGGLDIAFARFIDQFNLFDGDIDIRTVKTIDRQTYCWCEYIVNKPCYSRRAIENYYTKEGALIAFLNLLQGTDIHFENIIACGDNPMLIDIECLFNTHMEQFGLLNLGMIPLLTAQGDQSTPLDLSGMGANGTMEADHKTWQWKNVGTDALNLEKEKGFYKAKGNQPVYSDKTYCPEAFIEQIILGFDRASKWITLLRQQPDDENNPLSYFKNQSIRILPRVTQSYYDILGNSYTPQALESKEAREKVITDNLAEFPLLLKALSPYQKEQLFDSERKAIERLDIPFFTANTSAYDIRESGAVTLHRYFNTTPYESIWERLISFDDSKIQEQKNWIRSAFVSRYNIQLSKPTARKLTVSKNGNKRIQLVDEIVTIADNTVKAIAPNSAEIEWASFTEDRDCCLFGFINNSLYSGKTGIALFLHYLSRHLKTTRYDHIIDPVFAKEIAWYNNENNANAINISLNAGVSGLIYALLRTERHNYLDAAIQLGDLITKEKIKQDAAYDIMSGIAGTLVACCELYTKTTSPAILEKCVLIGEHLVKQSIYDEVSRARCWNSSIGNPLTGFSHGAAGIGYSLLRLYEITGSAKFRDAFDDTIRFENSYFDKQQCNWQDLRHGNSRFQNSWCHGAAGIGLARIYAYKILKDESLLADIQNAIRATKEMTIINTDHYCCGNVGRIDFLLEASRLLKDNELEKYCMQQILLLLDKKDEAGYYQTYENKSLGIENPSLFRGTAGIGYVLLKSLGAGDLPSLGF